MERLVGVAAVLFAILLQGCNADRTNLKIYEPIKRSFPCFRRLNGTHQIGCASPLTGEVGVVHLVKDKASLEWVTNKGPHDPYVVAMYSYNLTSQVMSRLKASGRVSGVLVLNITAETKKLEQFSMDSTCPNKGFGLYVNSTSADFCEWNEAGQEILFENYDFPIFYVQDERESLEILKCYNDFNLPIDGLARDWPLCAAQLKAHMFAAVDTPTCMRRSQRFSLEKAQDRVCDPVGDLNLWASVLPSNQTNSYEKSNRSVIVISARMDSASLFEGLARGADSAGTGIATLLAIVKQLSLFKEEILQKSDQISNVYFILFHGESFGYIGSSRMVYDMKKGDFPSGINENDTDVPAKLNITDIKYYIEIGQVGAVEDNAKYYIHKFDNPLISPLVDTLLAQGKGKVDLTTSTAKSLPTSSLQSFLKERPSLPGVVITNFDQKFKNRFYNSLFDDAGALHYHYEENKPSSLAKNIAGLSAVISNAVLSLVGIDPTVKPDDNTANELLHCYVESGKCRLFQNITGDDKIPDAPLDMYVGVNRHYITSTQLTRVLMMYYQGDNVTSVRTEDDCKTPDNKRNVNYQWINGSCYETTVNVTQALSPAFVIDNYDWKSGEFSTYTESIWKEFSVRIFVKPSKTHEIVTLVSGILVFIVSFVMIGLISSKSDIIFPIRPAGMAC